MAGGAASTSGDIRPTRWTSDFSKIENRVTDDHDLAHRDQTGTGPARSPRRAGCRARPASSAWPDPGRSGPAGASSWKATSPATDVRRAAVEILSDPVVEAVEVRPARRGRRGRWRIVGRARPAQAGRHRPRGRERPRLLRDLGYAVAECPDDPDLSGRRARRGAPATDRAAAGQRRRRAGGRRPAAVRSARPGADLRVPPGGRADPRARRRRR